MEYAKCLVEVDEVLKYLNPEELVKIPVNVRKAISDNKDKNYDWEYDVSKKLEDQNLNRKSIAILSYLNMEYLLNDEQRKLMEQIHKLNEQKQEEEKKVRYNPDNIFKNKTMQNEKNNIERENVEQSISKNEYIEAKSLTILQKGKWYNKILLYIKGLFYKKS